MTKEQLERANFLSKEIREFESIVFMLKRTINNEEKGVVACVRKLIRFCNGNKRNGRPPEARVILFDGTSNYGDDLPVDLELLKCLHGFFSARLENMRTEFEQIGGESNG